MRSCCITLLALQCNDITTVLELLIQVVAKKPSSWSMETVIFGLPAHTMAVYRGISP